MAKLVRKLYIKLNDQLDKDDEKKIRTLLRGNQISKREIETLSTPGDIFIKLEESGHIGDDNLSLLKDIFKDIERQPLMDLIVEYEKSIAQEDSFQTSTGGLLIQK